MKKVNVNQVILDFEGNPIKVSKGEKEESLTFRTISLNCLGQYKGSGQRIIEAFDLGTKIVNNRDENGVIELENAEVMFLQECVEMNNPGYVALVLAPVLSYLKGLTESKK